MPMGKYKNFNACLSAGNSKAYCGKLFWETHGKKEGTKKLKKEVSDIKGLISKLLQDGNIEYNLSMYISNRKDGLI